MAASLRASVAVIYQDTDGQRQAVDGRFVLLGGAPGNFEVGFDVGAYDTSRALVIDPAGAPDRPVQAPGSAARICCEVPKTSSTP